MHVYPFIKYKIRLYRLDLYISISRQIIEYVDFYKLDLLLMKHAVKGLPIDCGQVLRNVVRDVHVKSGFRFGTILKHSIYASILFVCF